MSTDGKQYHTQIIDPNGPNEMSIFLYESTAYRRLKAESLCERGVVPDFYGTIMNIESTRWPEL